MRGRVRGVRGRVAVYPGYVERREGRRAVTLSQDGGGARSSVLTGCVDGSMEAIDRLVFHRICTLNFFACLSYTNAGVFYAATLRCQTAAGARGTPDLRFAGRGTRSG